MLKLGTIVTTRGYDGTLWLTDIPFKIKSINIDTEIFIGFSEQFSKKYILKSIKFSDKGAELSIVNISSNEISRQFKEMAVFIDEANIIKTQGKFNPNKIIGCKVINFKNAELLGEITEVWELPANDVWVCINGKKELLLPVIDEVIIDIDLRKKIIKVNLIDGLEDLNG
jgi:16S rRNA processing protein RimM